MKRTHNMTVAENVRKTLTDIARKMGGGTVKIGFMSDTPLGTYPDGTPVAAVAFWDEFGHGGRFPAPPRPYFRTMIASESPSWPGKMASLAKATNFDGAKVLALMGEDISAALQESIANFNEIPLAKSTLILRAKFWSNREQITGTDVAEAVRIAYTPKTQEEAAANPPATGTQAEPLVWTGQMLRAVTYEVDK